MQTNVKPAKVDDAKRVLQALAAQVPTIRVAADTGIHQSQVSRLFRGHFKRVSPNVRRLLVYARDPRRYQDKGRAKDAAKMSVIRAALQTWDTTPEGAQALVRLLRSVEGIRRLRR